MDEVAVEFLYKFNSIMKLLGISPLCTGLRPELAQKMVEVCGDISSLEPMANVEQALKHLK
jgi:rsbT co-antagonist protein RsbR